jgi:ribosomal protein S27E
MEEDSMSKLSVSCPSCAKRYAVPDSYAGKKFKCKDCGAVISIPGGEAPAVEPEEPAAEEEEAPRSSPRRSTAGRRPARRRPAARHGRRSARDEAEEEDHAPAGRAHSRTGHRGGTGGATSRYGGRRGAHAGQEQPNRGLLILSGVGCIVLVVALFVYFLFIMQDKKPVTRTKPRRTVAEEPAARQLPDALKGMEEEDPGFGEPAREEPKPEPAPAKVAAAKPEKKPEAGKPAAEEPKKKSLPPLPVAKVRKIPHYDSTPPELRTEIDDAIQVLLEPWGGARANRKKAFLVEKGKASVPALLSAMVDLDFTNEEQRNVMPLITEALYDITKSSSRNGMVCRVGMQETLEEQIYVCKYRRAEWFEWLDRFGKEYLK